MIRIAHNTDMIARFVYHNFSEEHARYTVITKFNRAHTFWNGNDALDVLNSCSKFLLYSHGYNWCGISFRYQ